MQEFEFFVGFDWASQKHVACLLDSAGQVMGEREVDHAGAGLSAFIDWLLTKTGVAPDRIAIAIETTHGPVVETFLERGFAVYAINPKQLDRFRDRFTVAGAKDDSRDALVLGDSLRTDARAFRPLMADPPLVVELREWSRLRDELLGERVRLTNRMREQLWRYYPQALKLTDDLAQEWFLALWQLVPEPSRAAKFRKPPIERILRLHRISRINAEEVITILREEPITVSKGTVAAATAHIQSIIGRLKLLNVQIKAAEKKIDEFTKAIENAEENEPGQTCGQRDVAILSSCAGLGRIVLATLLTEARQPLNDRDYQVLRCLAGQAPVTRRSGKSHVVLRRTACNKRLRNALFHWARAAIQRDPASRARYASLRARGHGHPRALRAVGDRLLLVACTMLERQTFYDPDLPSGRAPRAAAVKDAKHRQSRRAKRVLDGVSTALQCLLEDKPKLPCTKILLAKW